MNVQEINMRKKEEREETTHYCPICHKDYSKTKLGTYWGAPSCIRCGSLLRHY